MTMCIFITNILVLSAFGVVGAHPTFELPPTPQLPQYAVPVNASAPVKVHLCQKDHRLIAVETAAQ